MPRRRHLRKVVAPPGFKGYRPFGYRGGRNRAVELLYEEYEAIKLADYDMLSHDEACVLMGISRPTFARIYKSARQKIAKALVETREIKSVFGYARFDEDWFLCNDCHARFSIPETAEKNKCPMCKSEHIEPINKHKEKYENGNNSEK